MYKILSFLLLFIVWDAQAQMIEKDGMHYYGNEWIDYDATYYKVKVAKDSVYHITGATLREHGIPTGSVLGKKIRLFHNGEQVPVYVSEEGVFADDDFIEFYGKKNRGELDRFLYHKPDEQQLNPLWSMFTDTAVYFLAFDGSEGNPLHYKSISNDLSNHPPAETYFMDSITQVFHDTWYKITEEALELSLFDVGEGYANNNKGRYLKQDIVFELPHLYLGNADGKCVIRYSNVSTNGAKNSRAEIHINGELFKVDNFKEESVRQVEFDIDNVYLNPLTTVSLSGTQNSSDYLNIPFVTLKYPREFNFEDVQFKTLKIEKSSLPTYLEMEHFGGSDRIIMLDRTNLLRLVIDKDPNDGKYKVQLPPSVKDREMVIFNTQITKPITRLEKRVFQNIKTNSSNFVIITNSVFDRETNGVNPIQAYANYRSSAEGGSYKVMVFHIDEIEDAFAWGVLRHSIAIRQFNQYINSNWPDAQYTLLIGRGAGYPFFNYSPDPPENHWLFVPTFGQPGSDVLLGSDTSDLPVIAIGRIPAINGEEIMIYLNKLKEYEAIGSNTDQTIENRGWTKEFIHMSGGDITKVQQEIIPIANHLKQLENVVRKPFIGAHTTTFYKQNLGFKDPASKRMRERINNGASFITYLGHSNFSLIDFNIDPPETYLNKGRYYIFMSLGCLVGDLFRPNNRSFGEQHTLIPDRGGIVFMGNTTNEYQPPLRRYSSVLYHRLNEKNYRMPFGKVVMLTGKDVIHLNNKETQRTERQLLRLNEQVWSTTYDGDPALQLPFRKDPDYLIDVSSVELRPKTLYKGLDSFLVRFAVANIGAAIDTSFDIKLQHRLPNGKVMDLNNIRIKAPYDRDTFTTILPLPNDNSIIGLNHFLITLDANNEVEEYPTPQAEFNNTLIVSGEEGYPAFIASDDVFPVYPEEFAIVNKDDITLTASNSKYRLSKRKYYFQIDTTALFDSPELSTYDVTTSSPDVRWNLPFKLIPNRVYYWRTTVDSTGRRGFAWKTRSFIYFPDGPTGWNQSHRYQFERDKLSKMEVDMSKGLLSFEKVGLNIRVTNNTFPRPDRYRPRWYYGNDVKQSWENWMPSSAIAIAVINPITGKLWQNPVGGLYGAFNPKRQGAAPINVFPFYVRTAEERDNVEKFLSDIIPDGSIILFYTIVQKGTNYHPEQWAQDPGDNIITILEEQGAKEVKGLINKGSVPYIFCYKKNGSSSFMPVERIGNDTDVIEARLDIHPFRNEGWANSLNIGPGQGWKSFEWNVKEIEKNDIYKASVIGIDDKGAHEVLLDNLKMGSYDLSMISNKQYPKLQLRFYAKDDTNHTTVQMPYWRVYYDPLPDAAVSTESNLIFKSDTLIQGEQIMLTMPIHNLTPVGMDSILVKYTIINRSTNESVNSQSRVSPLAGNAEELISYRHSTLQLHGDYRLIVELNPNNDQPELLHYNNIATFDFYVNGDNEKPLLDVTFDKAHILDEELVSSKPEIQITLRDNNDFFALKDTSLFDVYISKETPITSHNKDSKKLNLSDPDVAFFPADLSTGKNEARLVIHRRFEDGKYYMMVSAKDNVGNKAGQVDYRISFRVINKNAISNIVNYPNPFTSSTRFVYTLTGETLPEDYHLQIMTVTGKVIREVSKEELGPLRFGTHMTEFAWDGKDAFGEPLAAGVYLYRFYIKKQDGEDMERLTNEDYGRLNDLDKYFKNNIGKMVLMH